MLPHRDPDAGAPKIAGALFAGCGVTSGVRQLTVPVDSHSYYCTYGPMVLRRCRRLLGDDQAARDAMHDVFVQVLTRADDLVERVRQILCETRAHLRRALGEEQP